MDQNLVWVGRVSQTWQNTAVQLRLNTIEYKKTSTFLRWWPCVWGSSLRHESSPLSQFRVSSDPEEAFLSSWCREQGSCLFVFLHKTLPARPLWRDSRVSPSPPRLSRPLPRSPLWFSNPPAIQKSWGSDCWHGCCSSSSYFSSRPLPFFNPASASAKALALLFPHGLGLVSLSMPTRAQPANQAPLRPAVMHSHYRLFPEQLIFFSFHLLEKPASSFQLLWELWTTVFSLTAHHLGDRFLDQGSFL